MLEAEIPDQSSFLFAFRDGGEYGSFSLLSQQHCFVTTAMSISVVITDIWTSDGYSACVSGFRMGRRLKTRQCTGRLDLRGKIKGEGARQDNCRTPHAT